MTEGQLDQIESALSIKLPAEYRRVSLAFPFRPLGQDCVYWFYDDPAQVIGETLAPLADGGYDKSGWRDGYLVIGSSPAGDPYILDTAAPGLPVLCLSHETHATETEWPTFEAFVAEWFRVGDEVARRHEAERAARRAWWRRGWLITGGIVLLGIALPIILLLLIGRN